MEQQRQTKFHTDITTLRLGYFIEVLVNNSLSALSISGHPTTQELTEAWQQILDQYNDMMGDGEHQAYFQTVKAVAILKTTIVQVSTLITVLAKAQPLRVEPHRQGEVDAYLNDFENKLNKLLSTNIKFNRNNGEEYQKLLKGCSNRAKAFKIDLDLKEMAQKQMEERHGDGSAEDKKPYTKRYFINLLITLSNHARHPLTEDITVYEFCERIRRYNDEIQKLQRQTV